MSKLPQLDPKLVEKSIVTIINGHYGIKLNNLMITLCHNLMNEGFEVNADEIQNLIYTMIDSNVIVEITYTVPGSNKRNRSFLLPRGSVIEQSTLILDTPTPAYVQPPRPGSPTDDVGHKTPRTTAPGADNPVTT